MLLVRAHHGPEELELLAAHVLELVHQHELVAAPHLGHDLGVGPQESHGEAHEVVEVERVARPHRLLEVVHHRPHIAPRGKVLFHLAIGAESLQLGEHFLRSRLHHCRLLATAAAAAAALPLPRLPPPSPLPREPGWVESYASRASSTMSVCSCLLATVKGCHSRRRGGRGARRSRRQNE